MIKDLAFMCVPVLIIIIGFFIKKWIDDIEKKIDSSNTKLGLVNSEVKTLNENILNLKISSEKSNALIEISSIKNQNSFDSLVNKQTELNSKFSQLDDVMLKIIKMLNHFKVKIESTDHKVETLEIKLTDELSIFKSKRKG